MVAKRTELERKEGLKAWLRVRIWDMVRGEAGLKRQKEREIIELVGLCPRG